MRVLLLLGLPLMLGCSSDELPSGSYDKRFDSALWQQDASLSLEQHGVTVRQQMLGDLVEAHLDEKSREQIVALLGTPSTKMDPDGNGSALAYPTGPERGAFMAIDAEWLIIEFNEARIYESAHLAWD